MNKMLSYEEFKVSDEWKDLRERVQCDPEAYVAYLEISGNNYINKEL